jgi:hypothetical protein
MSLSDYKNLQAIVQKSQDIAKRINKLHATLASHAIGVYDQAMEDAAKQLGPLYDEAIRLAAEAEKIANKCGNAIDRTFGGGTGAAQWGPPKSKKRNAARAELDEEDYDPLFDDTEAVDDFIIPESAHGKSRSRASGRISTPRNHPSRSNSHHYSPAPPAYTPAPAYTPTPLYAPIPEAHPNLALVKTGDEVTIPRGQQVAAKIVQPNQDPSWILGSIVEFMSHNSKYRIKDDDPGEAAYGAQEYLVHGKNVVWLSEASNVLTYKGGEVLAMYPESTIFYKATVVASPPSRVENYTLFFDGEASGQVKTVNGCYVFPFIP